MTASCGKKELSVSTDIKTEKHNDFVSVIGRASPLEHSAVYAKYKPGLTVRNIVGNASDDVKVSIEGQYISRDDWHRVKPKAGTTLEIVRAPQEDVVKSVVVSIVIVAIAVSAPYLIPGLAGTLGGTVLTASIMIIGGALLAPQPPKLGDVSGASGLSGSADRYNAITSTSNGLNQYGSVNKLFGKNWLSPPMAALPYSEVRADSQFVYTLLAIGYGNLKVLGVEMPYGAAKISVSKTNGILSNPSFDLSLIKIGDTVLSEFDDFHLEVGYKNDISMFVDDILEDRVDVVFNRDTQPLSVIRTTASGVDSASIDLTFNQGLYSMNAQGNIAANDSVTFSIQYAPSGSTNWSPFNGGSGNVVVKGGEKTPFAKSFEMKFPLAGSYDIKVTRLSSVQGYSDYIYNDSSWTTIRSVKIGQTFGIDNVLLLALKVRANDQLSGSLDNVRVYTETMLPDFDVNGLTGTYSVSNNPSMAYMEAMIGVQNEHKIPVERIDFDELVYWRDWCDLNSIKYDNIHSGNETLLQRLMAIPSVAFANHCIVDGKFSVVTDKIQPVSHVITPKNTKSFSAVKSFVDLPHGFRVEFTTRDGKVDEVIAYADGYNSVNSTKFELLQTSGIRDPLQAWKYGRYHLAQATLRSETYTVAMDVEQLRVVRGDTVKLAYDVMLVGLSWGRVSSLSATELVVDERLPFVNGQAYSMLVRKNDGTTIEFPVTAPAGERKVVQWVQQSGVEVGDVFAFGEAGRVTVNAKVTEVSASDKDLGATVKMVDAADNIFDAWTGDVPDFDPLITVPMELRKPLPPIINGAFSGIDNLIMGVDGSFITTIDLIWIIQSSPIPVSSVEITYKKEGGEIKKVSIPLSDTHSYHLSNNIISGAFYEIYINSISFAGIRSDNSQKIIVKAFEVSDYVDTSVKPVITSALSGTSQLIKNNDGTISSRILVTWLKPAVSAGVLEYEIEYKVGASSNYQLISSNGNELSCYINNIDDGVVYDIRVRAVYRFDITSAWSSVYTQLAIGKEEKPSEVTGFISSVSGADILLTWDGSIEADNKEYEIRYGGSDWDSAAFVLTVKTTSWLQKAVTVGQHKWRIKAIDTTGFYSDNETVTTIVIEPPLKPTLSSQVVDNNVLLYWSSVRGTLPIDHYRIYRGSDFIGSKKGDFTTIFETSAGTYQYGIVAVDVAGNQSDKGIIYTSVTQPPDYVLNVIFNDDFSGVKTNAIVDEGLLILPINLTETYDQHFTSNSFSSPQDQVAAGYEVFIQPSPDSASYERVFDYGTLLSGTQVSLLITSTINSGSLSLSTTISVSADGINYTDYSNVSQVFALNFRYVKIRLDYSGSGNNDTISISNISVKLDSKIKRDSGSGTITSAPTGSSVLFNTSFIDVTSITVTAAHGSGAVSAIYDFVDTPNPLGFTAYLLDSSGNFVTGDFSWSITGY